MSALGAHDRALAAELREPGVVDEVILFCENDGKPLVEVLAAFCEGCAVSSPRELLLHDADPLAELILVVVYVLLYFGPQALCDLLVADARDSF